MKLRFAFVAAGCLLAGVTGTAFIIDGADGSFDLGRQAESSVGIDLPGVEQKHGEEEFYSTSDEHRPEGAVEAPENLASTFSGDTLTSPTVTGETPENYVAGEDGLPTTGMDGVDLSGISRGGGLGPESPQWADMAPSSVSIPEANLAIPYVPKGVSGGQMELPVSFQAGWLNTSAPPVSKAGTSVIAGHVNWSDGSWAPMSNLYNASPGMTVRTSDASGDVEVWKVTDVRSVPQDRLSELFSLDDTEGERKLLLVTCKSEDGGLTYGDNLVVTATPA